MRIFKKECKKKSVRKKSKVCKVFIICAVAGLLTATGFTSVVTHGVSNVAQIIGMAAVTVQAAQKDDVISVRVKAEVPKTYAGDISISYIGKNTKNKLDVVLNEENDYIYDLTLEKDIYTVKSKEVSEYYTVNLPDSFSTEDATVDKVYLLPVTVLQESTDTKETVQDVMITLKANVPESYTGEISVIYTGTEPNNEISVILTKDVKYKTSIKATKDIYTLENIKTTDGFEGTGIYSFDLNNANEEDTNTLEIFVTEKTEKEDTDDEIDVEVLGGGEKKENIKDGEYNTSVQAAVPEDYVGTIYVCYTGEATEGFNCELTAENGYSTNIKLDADIYNMLYAVSYDNDEYEYKAMESFTVAEGQEIVNVPVKLYKDGKEVVVEDVGNADKNTDNKKDETKKGGFKFNFKFDQSTFWAIVIIIGGIAFLIFKSVNKRKGKDFNGEEIEYEDEEDEEEYVDDEEE